MYRFKDLTDESKKIVLDLLDSFNKDQGHNDDKVVIDIEKMGFAQTVTEKKVREKIEQNKDKIIKLTPYNINDDAVLYYFGADYKVPELRCKSVVVDKGEVYVVSGVTNLTAGSKDDKPLGIQTVNEKTSPTFTFQKTRAKRVPEKYIGFFGKIIKEGVPALEKAKQDLPPEPKDVYAIFPVEVVRSKQTEIKNPKANAYWNASRAIGKLKKGKKVYDAQPFDDRIELAFTKGKTDTDKLDVWVHVHPTGVTTATTDISQLTLDYIKKSGEWFKVTEDRIKFKNGNIVIDTYDAKGAHEKGDHPLRIVCRPRQGDDTLSRLRSAQSLEGASPYATAFAGSAIESDLRVNGSLQNLDELVDYSLTHKTTSDERGKPVQKISKLKRTLKEAILFFGGIAAGTALGALVMTAGIGDANVAASRNAAAELSYQNARQVLVVDEVESAENGARAKESGNIDFVITQYNDKTGKYDIHPGSAATIAKDMTQVVNPEEIAQEVAPYGVNWSFTGLATGKNPYADIVNTEVSRALGEAVGAEIASLSKAEIADGVIYYPVAEGDMTTKANFVTELEQAGYDNVDEIVSAYEEGYGRSYTTSKETNEVGATGNPTIPDDYEEIDDGKVYYTNNPTFVSSMRDLVGTTDAQINSVYVVEQNGISYVTIYATGNSGANAYEINFETNGSIETTEQLYNALNNAKKEKGRDAICEDYELASVPLSSYGLKADNINSTMSKTYGAQVGNNGTTYVATDLLSDPNGDYNVSVLYLGDKGATVLPITVGVDNGRVGSNAVKSLAILSVYDGYSSKLPSCSIEKGDAEIYQNAGEVYVEADYVQGANKTEKERVR